MGSTVDSVVGENFAWNLMKSQGWSSGDGLGKHRQGRRDAIKPRLKFDGHGLGHDRSEEFEFHWWDHLFNTAAKGVTVNNNAGENGGEITVSFQADKSERSAKKMRRKMQKEMKNRLYSRFVRAGTLKGEKDEESEDHEVVTEVKDTGKIKTMSDEDLIKACGGRTAHKGARHGQNMDAKLQRIQDAEEEFVRKYKQQQEDKLKKKEKKVEVKEVSKAVVNTVIEDQNEQPVKKRKKEKKEKVLIDTTSASNESVAEDNSTEEESTSKKRKKCKKDKVQENVREKVEENVTASETTDETIKKKKKQKHKKQKDQENMEISHSVEIKQDNGETDISENLQKKKKKSKKKSKDTESNEL